MKGDLKAVGLIVAGVMIAGYIFKNFSDIDLVNQSRKGFSGLL